MAAATAIAKYGICCRRSFSSLKFHLNFNQFHKSFTPSLSLTPQFFHHSISTLQQKPSSHSKKKKRNKTENQNPKNVIAKTLAEESRLKRRTRSEKKFDQDVIRQYGDDVNHVPVMLGEVLDVFSAVNLRSFVDCTVGAAGHSVAIIQAHPEMQLYVGLDVDPIAHEKAQVRINSFLHGESCHRTYDLKMYTLLKNFKDFRSVLEEVDERSLTPGVNGILMDLGMSSMQVNNAERGFSVLADGPLDMRMDPKASLKAEDILNFWPDTEVGRILRDYGEESNWYNLQNKIVKARASGGLHSTVELVDLIRKSAPSTRGGRHGWIKTATRVFQALRIAVNDELNTLKTSLYSCFDCLSPGGRLAVISFHSLEDRIVKQTFLDIIGEKSEDEVSTDKMQCRLESLNSSEGAWVKQIIPGQNGKILTKRPITPSQEEEKLNRRCRSAKLRVIQKV
ncbi:Ribosomal RNA small subunit methyltransferase H [Dillenia turbinata]|uniref:Ribosomal RNA small subunit methyltransferase H n=1 Tax=Dillenia turbinata TaxID=194707 RepID=A0AAN8YSN1_9MAGN